jgi:hypothetical protein
MDAFVTALREHTVPYAIGNILLTAWGPVILARMR